MTTDNRTNEPSEAQVEAAAKAMWDLRKLISDPEWDALEYGVKLEYRKDARAALVAAAPIPQPVIDEAALMDALREAFIDEAMTEDSTAGIWIVETPLEDALPGLARAVAARLKDGAR